MSDRRVTYRIVSVDREYHDEIWREEFPAGEYRVHPPIGATYRRVAISGVRKGGSTLETFYDKSQLPDDIDFRIPDLRELRLLAYGGLTPAEGSITRLGD